MITKEIAIKIHEKIAERTGGDVGVRDIGILEGALASPYMTFGGVELYPTPLEKAAHLGFSVISSHPFVDGNKRVGVVLMLTLLLAYGCKVDITNRDVYHVGISVAAGGMNERELFEYLCSRARITAV